jgi:hypothetical protein
MLDRYAAATASERAAAEAKSLTLAISVRLLGYSLPHCRHQFGLQRRRDRDGGAGLV